MSTRSTLVLQAVLLVSRDLRTEFARPAESWREPPKKSGSPASVPGPALPQK